MAYPVEKKQPVVIHKNFTYSCFLFSLESFRCLPLGAISAVGARLLVEGAANEGQVQYSVSFQTVSLQGLLALGGEAAPQGLKLPGAEVLTLVASVPSSLPRALAPAPARHSRGSRLLGVSGSSWPEGAAILDPNCVSF